MRPFANTTTYSISSRGSLHADEGAWDITISLLAPDSGTATSKLRRRETARRTTAVAAARMRLIFRALHSTHSGSAAWCVHNDFYCRYGDNGTL